MPKHKHVEREKTAAKVRAYLARHAAGDADARGLSLDAIASGAGCSRTPLSDPTCPLMQQVRDEIEGVRRARAVPRLEDLRDRLAAPAMMGLEFLTDADLTQRIHHAQRQAARIMGQWLGYHGRGGAVDDAALARHDLERALRALRRVANNLGPLVETLEEREAARPLAPPPASAPAVTYAAQEVFPFVPTA